MNEEFRRSVAGCISELKPLVSKIVNMDNSEGHVMLSYQWDYQPLVIEVKNRLKGKGIKTWFDLENMKKDSLLESMAFAVENAELVVSFYSDKYKRSVNCRKEASFADKLQKPLLFIRVEKGYKPDGWLNFLLLDKIFVDLNESTIDIVVENIIQELFKLKKMKITDELSREVTATIPHETHHPLETLFSTNSQKNLEKWSDQDVQIWIREMKLDFASKM